MIKIRELQKEKWAIYIREIYDEGRLESSDIIDYYTYTKEIDNNFIYLVLYDENMEIVEDVFDYLNISIINHSINTRIKSLQALRILFIFQKIIHKDIYEFNKDDIISS